MTDRSRVPLASFLKSLPLFSQVSLAALATLAGSARMLRLPRGATLFLKEDPADSAYVLVRGSIAIQLDSPEGQQMVINEMEPGDCFGELGLLTGQPRSTSAAALSDCEVAQIPGDVFRAVLEKEPVLSLRLLELTARRLQESSQREESLAFHDAQQRLARLLLHLDGSNREKGYLTFSQEELALRVSLTRQTVAEILGRWRNQGWLLTGRGHIVLLNRRAISGLLEEVDIGG